MYCIVFLYQEALWSVILEYYDSIALNNLNQVKSSNHIYWNTFSLSVALGFGWSLWYFSSMPLQTLQILQTDVIVQSVQIWRVSMNPIQFACSQFGTTLKRREMRVVLVETA